MQNIGLRNLHFVFHLFIHLIFIEAQTSVRCYARHNNWSYCVKLDS